MVIISTNAVAVSIQAVSPLFGVGAGAAWARAGWMLAARMRAAKAAIGKTRKARASMLGIPLVHYRSACASGTHGAARHFARRVPNTAAGLNPLILRVRRAVLGAGSGAGLSMRSATVQQLPSLQTAP